MIQIKGIGMARFRYKSNERQGDMRAVTVEFLTDGGATVAERSFTVTSHDQQTLDVVVNAMGAVVDKEAEVAGYVAGWDEMANRVTTAEAAAAAELQRQQQADALDAVLNRHIAEGTVLETKATT